MADHNSTREQGLYAEALVLEHLERRGLRLVTRNYLIKGGEIDLIMAQNETLVFVEVRARESFENVHPFETVTKAKQARIIRTAKHYLWTHDLLDACLCRFDVVAVNLSTGKIEWIEGAFD
jgi:putative endonuclease